MSKKTCIVIPCYNEAERLDLMTFGVFGEKYPDVDFCFVNDGSTDDTGKLLEDFCCRYPEHFFVLDYAVNAGKAEAVRMGICRMLEKGTYEQVGFLDADLATPLEEMRYLIHTLEEKEEAEGVIGSRVQRLGAVVERNWLRHYAGRGFATLVSLLFHLKAYDTQCGAKIFRTSLAEVIFREPFLSHWLFDVEILLRARRIRPDYAVIIQEVPLRIWFEKGGSKIKMTHVFRMLWDLYRIRKNFGAQ